MSEEHPAPAVDPERPDAAAPADPVEPDPVDPSPREYAHRRAPRYRAFAITGAVIGVLAGLALALSRPAEADFSLRAIVGYFAAILGLGGALLGLALALLLERRHR